MTGSEDAQWIASVLRQLHIPQASLVRELLAHLAALQEESDEDQPHGAPPRTGGGEEPAPPESLRRHLRRRHAIFRRLHDGWTKARDLPACSWQFELLKETAILGNCVLDASTEQVVGLATDPLSEEEGVPLTLHRGRSYAHKALDIAEEIGDQVAIGEACMVLSRHYMLASDFPKALEYCRRAAVYAERTGALHVLDSVYGRTNEIHSLTRSHAADRIANLDRYASVLRKMGTYHRLLGILCLRAWLAWNPMLLNGPNPPGRCAWAIAE